MTEHTPELPADVVAAPAGSWATPDEVRDRWRDAPMDEALLVQMMTAAQDQLESYVAGILRRLPVGEDGRPVLTAGQTARFREALALQVRANGEAWNRDGDVLGFGDGFAVRVRPLGADVKALMRPRRARGVIR